MEERKIDYYPFGMTEPGRSWNAGDYRFGYTGHEKESDLAEGVYTTQYRLLDTRLGRWMSVDPLFTKYPDQGSYAYCVGNPNVLVDLDGMYPEGVVEPKDKNSDIYKLKPAASHLLSLVSGADEQSIRLTYIVKRAPGHYMPWYSSNSGGGAITLGNSSSSATIILTQNYYADDRQEYDNHGYGKNAKSWLYILSHEVGHLPQIDEHDGMWSYMASFAVDYVTHLGHDAVPREQLADLGYEKLLDFNKFVENKEGTNALWDLFKDDKLPQSYIMDKIDTWWSEYTVNNNFNMDENQVVESGK